MSNSFGPADRIEIHELTARYAWSLDTGDEQEFVECFCRDGELVWDAFETEGRWRGEEALRGFIGYFRQRPESAGRQHHVSNLIVTPTAQGAVAKCYVAVTLRREEGPHVLHVMGYYEDELRHEGGRWRFARRRIRDWSGPVLSAFAGQQCIHRPRPLPAALAELWHTQSGQS
jgi:hypothetical protein